MPDSSNLYELRWRLWGASAEGNYDCISDVEAYWAQFLNGETHINLQKSN